MKSRKKTTQELADNASFNTCICQSGIGDSVNFSVIESQNHLIAYVFNNRIFVNTSHETRSELDR